MAGASDEFATTPQSDGDAIAAKAATDAVVEADQEGASEASSFVPSEASEGTTLLGSDGRAQYTARREGEVTTFEAYEGSRTDLSSRVARINMNLGSEVEGQGERAFGRVISDSEHATPETMDRLVGSVEHTARDAGARDLTMAVITESEEDMLKQSAEWSQRGYAVEHRPGFIEVSRSLEPDIESLEPVSAAEAPEVVRGEVAESPYVAYEQGNNDLEFLGTCGPTTVANSLNTLFGGAEHSENSTLHVAVDKGLCQVEGHPTERGGTSSEQIVELYKQIEPERIEVERFEHEDVLTEAQIAERVESGDAVNVAVSSAVLWNGDSGSTGFFDRSATDHWIQVTGVHRGADGGIAGFRIVDSGDGVESVDATRFRDMYVGAPGRRLIDPVCIVVSRKA